MKTKLLFLALVVISGSLLAQPEPSSYFPFDDNLLDQMENVTSQAEGTVPPTIVADADRGNVLSFPGGGNDDGNRITLSTNAYNAFDAVTYNLWIKANALDTWSRFFTFGTEGVSGAAVEYWSTPANGRLAQRMSVTIDEGTDDPGVEVPFGDATIETGKWYMFTAALDETHCKLWVDGVVAGDSAHAGTKPSSQTIEVAYLGKSVWPDPILNGYIDNFKIFGSFLSDDDVAALYAAEATGVKKASEALNMVVYTHNNQIIVNDPANVGINSVKVYNMAGALVLQDDNCTGVIRHDLPANLYIVKVQTRKGDFITKVSLK
ncbi:MAG: T9SS type A sorting domain-containing protein [Bacteroidales bacterium]|nr:T9SS type A sorting domain-containing protein [Bacteroidales bacterium]MBN2762056.1 T9SS type A sorting domain-containing protein [Bacteroidales bacterium]